MGAMTKNSVEHGDFVRAALGTNVDPAWYGQKVTKEVATGTDVDGSPIDFITRRYKVAGLESLGTEARIRLRGVDGAGIAWCTVEHVRKQLGYKPAAPRTPRVRALDLGLG